MPAAAKIYMNPKAVTQAAIAALPRVLKRQGGYVRTSMARSIRTSTDGKPGNIGAQPKTHNKLLKRSMRWGLELPQKQVVIGPDYKMAGIIGGTHEYGGIETNNHIPGSKRSGFGVKKKTINWDLKIGGSGPIRIRGNQVIYGKLNTSGQVIRATKLAARAKRIYEAAPKRGYKGRKYPKRPFAGRTLTRVATTGKLAEFWRDSIGPTGGSGIGQLI